MTSGLELVAAELQQFLPPTRALVAIDGPDGSGKSTFAERLSHHLGPRPVIIIHLDDFLNTAAVRHARGRHSPEGYWLDSYNYTAFCSSVLQPLAGNGDAWLCPACYDREADAFVLADPVAAPAQAVILVEGLFLHREELAQRWTASVFLDVPFEETARRMAARDGTHVDPLHSSMRRYVEGQRLYYAAARPWERASLVVDNSGPQPRITSHVRGQCRPCRLERDDGVREIGTGTAHVELPGAETHDRDRDVLLGMRAVSALAAENSGWAGSPGRLGSLS